MNENETNALDFNRRDFLRSGSVATLMTMLGGVELLGETLLGRFASIYRATHQTSPAVGLFSGRRKKSKPFQAVPVA